MAELALRTPAGASTGTVALHEDVFGIQPNVPVMHQVVTAQLAKRRAGTHDVKNRGEIARTGAKLYKQKGTGRARHGSRRANVFKGGGRAFGPTPRDHATDLPKKVRALGLRCALSAKAKDGKLIVLDEARASEAKTKILAGQLAGLGIASALIVTGSEVDANFGLAARNLPLIDVLPSQGANVYDILRRDTLVLTTEAIRQLEERLA
jgi:large subunit ribosomal protein L4